MPSAVLALPAPAGPVQARCESQGDPTLRIRVTLDDLARTRVASGPNVLWEIALSIRTLQGGHGWAGREALRRAAARGMGGRMALLLPLIPAEGPIAGFLTPTEGGLGLEAGLAAVLATPPDQIRASLARLRAERSLPPWTDRLADDDREMLHRLAATLRAYHQAVLTPLWPRIAAQVEADRARRVRALLDGGWESLLASFRPCIRWRPPVLEVDQPGARELHARGHGVLLVPSYFCRGQPVLGPDLQSAPVLVYPVDREARPPLTAATGPAPRAESLAALLGHTRAAVLLAVRAGCTTTELGKRVGVSMPSASQHATVLREAGLIATQRRGGSVLHSLTPLGASLLSSP